MAKNIPFYYPSIKANLQVTREIKKCEDLIVSSGNRDYLHDSWRTCWVILAKNMRAKPLEICYISEHCFGWSNGILSGQFIFDGQEEGWRLVKTSSKGINND